jgi:hypothetical protein
VAAAVQLVLVFVASKAMLGHISRAKSQNVVFSGQRVVSSLRCRRVMIDSTEWQLWSCTGHGKGMFCQCDARRFLISPQGRLKKRLKMSRTRLVTHLRSREEVEPLEEGLVRCEEMIARRRGVMGRGLGRKSVHRLIDG